MLKTAFEKTQDVLKSKSDIHIEGFVSDLSSDALLKKTNFDFSLKLATDIEKSESSVFVLDADGQGSSDNAKPLSVSAQVRVNSEHAYVRVSKFEGLDDVVPADVSKQILGTWWDVPLPPEFLKTFADQAKAAQKQRSLATASASQMNSSAVVNPPSLNPLEDIRNSFLQDPEKAFSSLKYEDVETVKGGSSFRYKFVFSQDFLRKITDSMKDDKTLTEKDRQDALNFLASSTFEGKVWIDTDDFYVTKLEFNFLTPSYTAINGKKYSLSFRVDMDAYDFGDSVRFDTPKDAKVLSPEAFGAALGG